MVITSLISAPIRTQLNARYSDYLAEYLRELKGPG